LAALGLVPVIAASCATEALIGKERLEASAAVLAIHVCNLLGDGTT
jgi:hypothetical protein